MKHPLFNKTVLIITAAIALLFSSCNLLTLNTSEKTITVSGKINSDFDFNSSSSSQNRSSMPELSISNKIFEIKAVSGKKIVTTKTDSEGNFFLQLTAGSWNISASYYEEGKLVLSGETTVTVNEGSEQNPVSITVGPVQTATGFGTVMLEVAVISDYINFGENNLKIKATWKINDAEQTQTLSFVDDGYAVLDVPYTEVASFFDPFTFTPDGSSGPQNIPSGSYEVTFSFGYYDSSDNLKSLCYQCTETVNVYDNLCTKEWKDDTETAPYFRNVGGVKSLCLTADCIQNFAMYNYFVDENGSDSGSGSYNAPFTTIQAAVDKIIANNDETNNYTIYLLSSLTAEDNTVTEFNSEKSFVVIQTDNKLNLKITSLGNTAFTVDGNNKGHVFIIAGSPNNDEKIISVTFENIIIKNTNYDIWINRIYTELNIENGTVLSGNNASSEKYDNTGIFSNSNNVTLNINGGEIINNKDSGISISGESNVKLNITGGKISDNTSTNNAEGDVPLGSGIYYKADGGEFNISGEVDISDNIYLTPDSIHEISIAGDIQNENNAPIHLVVEPTSSGLSSGLQVLTESSQGFLFGNYSKFVLDNTGYEIASDGKIYPFTAVYVDTGYTGESFGTEDKPFTTIEDGLYGEYDENSLVTIYFKGSDTIDYIEIEKSIKLQGWKESADDSNPVLTILTGFDVADTNTSFIVKDIDVKVSSYASLEVSNGLAILSGSTSIKPESEGSESISKLIYISSGSLLLTDDAKIQNYYSTSSGLIDIKNGTVIINGNAAIEENNAKYIIQNEQGNLTITGSAKITGNTAPQSDYGGAIYNNEGEVTISGSAKLSENTAQNGGAIVNNEGEVTISGNSVIKGNTATQYGGAIYNRGGKLTISGSAELSENTASQYGGAIYNISTQTISVPQIGEVTISGNAELSENTATNGGAIMNYSGTVTVQGKAKIFSNKANDGGAIYNGNKNDSSDYVSPYGTVTIQEDVEIYSNEALTGNGGAIYNYNNYAVIIEGKAQIYSNEALAGNGGAIYSVSENASVTISENAKISKNKARSGGGIYHSFGEMIIKDQTEIYSNEALTGNGYGGAFYIGVRGIVTIEGEAKFYENKAKYGGAIYNDGVKNSYKGTITIQGNTQFYSNTASSQGGSIYNNLGDVTISGSTVISDNEATSSSGGAIYNDGVSSILTIQENTQIKSNKATTYGGAIYNKEGAVTIGSETDDENKVIISENTATGTGGAIYNTSGTVTVQGKTQISSNKANNGGAIYSSAGTFTVKGNTQIRLNEATSDGGAVYCGGKDSQVIIGIENDGENKVIISENTAGTNGGVIYNGDSGKVTIQGNTQIKSNKANNGNGGVIYNNKGEVEISGNVEIQDNEAVNWGGVIFNTSSGNVTIHGNVKIESNKVTNTDTYYGKGGAIFNASGIITIGTENDGENKVIISGNTASNSGGGIHNDGFDSYLIIQGNTQINTNTASWGGGICNSAGEVTIGSTNDDDEKHVTISGNISEYRGGAIYNDDNYGKVKIQGKTNISSNTSYEGGAISSYSGTVTIKGNTQIISNTATTTGGAIYNNSGQVTIQENVIIKENKAISTSTYSGKGGAIFTSSSKPVTIGDDESQVTISNNEASNSGGAIFISSGAVTIKNTTFSNNIPVNNQIEGTYTDEGNVSIE